MRKLIRWGPDMIPEIRSPGDQARGGKSKCCSNIVILNQAELKCHNCGKAHTSSFRIACSYTCYTQYQGRIAKLQFYQNILDWSHSGLSLVKP